MNLVSVAVPVPALGLLTYRVPDEAACPPRGARVVVPLGSRTLTGVVVGVGEPPDEHVEVRPLTAVVDHDPFLPSDVVELALWVGEYYMAGPGAALALALPPHGLSGRADASRVVRRAKLTRAGAEALSAADAKLSTRQRQALVRLNGASDGVLISALAADAITSAVLDRLTERGLVAIDSARLERDPFAGGRAALAVPETTTDRPLTADQQHAVSRLLERAASSSFGVTVLHGVTGSGKTEVYLRVAAAMQQRGRGVLLLVPEIALTPAMAAAFRARFGNTVAIQHSGLSAGERHDQWRRIHRGEVSVVVGTRSAVFAPLARLGLIIVDEEHDTSYKQEETPRYHARDVAVMRGKFANALVVLGSATPSLESFYNAEQGRYDVIAMPRRVLERPLAQVQVVNMREAYADEGPDVVLSRPLRDAFERRLDRGEQALILLNRRGYATAVFCRQCTSVVECPNCSLSLTVHTARRGWRAQCHYCNFSKLVPATCPTCAAPYLQHMGFGTERVEAELLRLFPRARVGRVDRDTIRHRGALITLLQQFAARELDVLVGTQMIAKGHDFPQVTLVGVISADVGLGLADFRAAERTFQLLTQVAGRAGRGEQAGEAIVQTLFPAHYSIRLATAQDYAAFYAHERQFRDALRYPPVVAMVSVVVRGKTFDAAMEGAAALAERARTGGAGTFALLGPAPAPLAKLRGEHRVQFFLKGRSRKTMREALGKALGELPALARRVAVDVDPVSVL